MTSYLIRRLLAVIPVMAVVVTVVFLLIHLIPGDPVAVMLGPDATPAQIDGTRKALGLDRPLLEQLLLFYQRVLRGDLGRSYFLDRPVTQALWERAEPTLVRGLRLRIENLSRVAEPGGVHAEAIERFGRRRSGRHLRRGIGASLAHELERMDLLTRTPEQASEEV